MIPKFPVVVLCMMGFAFFSCNRNEEKKETVLSSPTNTPVMEASMPVSNDLAVAEKKFELDSFNFEQRAVLAATYYSAGALEKAAYHFLKVYEHDNKNLIALSSLGNIYYDSQQDDKAIQFYEKALELDAQNINMKCDLATCYGNINKLKKAIQLLKENVEMDKNHVQSHHNLAIILQKKGDLAESAAEMKIYQSLIGAQK